MKDLKIAFLKKYRVQKYKSYIDILKDTIEYMNAKKRSKTKRRSNIIRRITKKY